MSDFYLIDGVEYPRVTSIIRVLDKSGPLMGWAVNCERRAFQAALEEVLTAPDIEGHEDVYRRVMKAVTGKRAWVREADRARDIGSEAHQLIQWHTSKMLGIDAGPEPHVSDPALQAVLAWLDWAQIVGFTPLVSERVLYCPNCRYAGTCDSVAKVAGVLTIIDYKSGKAIYPEALLQVNFYRHAGKSIGVEAEQAMVVRLPKTPEDPKPEMVVAPIVPVRCLQAILTTWRTMRWLTGEPTGDTPTKAGMCR